MAATTAAGFLRNKRQKRISKAQLDEVKRDKNRIQNLYEKLIDERDTYHPTEFIAKIDHYLEEAQPDIAQSRARAYLKSQSPAIAKAALIRAQAHTLNFGADGEPALTEAETCIEQGLLFQPTHQTFQKLQSEIDRLRSGKDPEISNLLKIDPNSDVSALIRISNKLYQKGFFAPANQVAEAARVKARVENGKTTRTFASATNSLARSEQALANYARAESLFKQAIEIDKAIIGADHPEYAIRLNNLASLYRDMGRPELAEPLY